MDAAALLLRDTEPLPDSTMIQLGWIQSDAFEPISHFGVPLDCIEAIARAMCEAAGVALPGSEGPRCLQTGYACSTAFKHRRCRCATCVAWRRGDLAGAGASDAFGSSGHREAISRALKGRFPIGVHRRYHVNRGIVNPACPHCSAPQPDEQHRLQ